MPIKRVNPAGLHEWPNLTQVAVTTDAAIVYVSGQGSFGPDGMVVGAGDHGAQFRTALANLLIALNAVGASWDDVLKVTYYVVDIGPRVLDQFAEALADVPGIRADPAPTATVLGVAALAYPEMLVEVDAVAVVAEGRR